MKRTLLNGINLRVPFLGAISTMVTEGDWRGADNRRPFVCRYQNEDDAGETYHIGWLSIFRDPPEGGSDHPFVLKALGCAVAVRAILLGLLS